MLAKTCIYYITFECNDSCEYCHIWDNKELNKIPDAPIDKHLENIKYARRQNAKTLEIVGGEPLLYEGLPRLLECARRFDFKINLTTNGILYMERARELRGLIDNIKFLIDYPSQEDHDRSRGTTCYNVAIDSIKDAIERRENPSIQFNITRDSVRFLPEMVELSEKLKVRLHVNAVPDFHGATGFDKSTYGHIKYYFKRKYVEMNLAELEFLKNHGNNILFPRCRAKQTTITYLPDGTSADPCFYNNGGRQGRESICYGCARSEYMLPSFKMGIDKYRLFDLYSCYLNSRKEI